MTMKWTDETRTATWPEGGAFHCANNLYFTRREDGGVTIRRYPSLDVGTEPDITVECTAEEWSSVVASMESGGETAESWASALNRQRPAIRAAEGKK